MQVHSHLPCADGNAIDDDAAVALPRGTAAAGPGAFSVATAGVHLHGFFSRRTGQRER